MTDMNVRGTGLRVAKHSNGLDGRRSLVNPSAGGPAHHLVKSVARGHGASAIAIATFTSFVVLAAFFIGLGFLITHVLEHGSIGAWDHHVIQWFDRHRTGGWNRITGDLTDMADTFEVAGVAAIVTLLLLFRRWGRKSFLLAAGLLIELSVFLLANKIVARPRPAVSHLGGTPSTYSFPSGHTAATVVLWGGIAVIVTVATSRQWPRIVMWAVAVLMSMSVGLSRVYRGEHYPTDVLSGLLLGTASLWAGVFIIRVACVNRPKRMDSAEQQSSVVGVGRLGDASQ